MSNEQKITTDIKVPNKDLDTLKLHFPHCFDKDGNFQLEKFKASLTEKEINFSTESYGLDWLGKSYARLLASDPATTLLKADETHNNKPENANSENLLIKGDNLEVLKHLANAYYEQVKMIYIDPPYNTGGDGFVYNDDRKFTVKELQQLIGIDAEKAKRILDFTQSKSNSHSAWLTFMYPRLYIAKQMLKNEGAIFISIDDNEVAQLRLLMDEVFGEENFAGQIVWQTATDNNPTQVATEHEYVLVFVKNRIYQDYWETPSEKGKIIQAKYEELKYELGDDLDQIQKQLRHWIRKQNNGDDLSGVAHYSYVDEKGVYYPGNSANTKPGGYNYDIIHPVTNEICAKPEYGYRFTLDTFNNADSKGDVQWGEDENTIPKIKKRLDTVTQKLKSYYYEDNRSTSAELKELFDGKKVFNNPKSINFLKHILKFITSENDLILDYFAGSGTTGDSIYRLNIEDYSKRKFILVQIPEEIDSKKNKVAFDFVKNELKVNPTIFEITKERISRASKKVKSEIEAKIKSKEKEIKELESKLNFDSKDENIKQLKVEIESLKNQDLGFKIFETTPIWEDYNFEAEQFDSSQTLFDVGKLSEDDIKALLITWKTYDGISLTQDLESVDLSGYTAYYGNGRLYLMNKGFTTDSLKALLEKIDTDKHFEPKSIIAFGYHLESKSLREISENVKTYNNKKKSDIDFITRY
ncbi:site-specific DNA-methyltransferase [Ignavibacteria bacterium CHB1]|nr:MAG: site-specific DNA-methyltransferase [Chlorobiota bacterium]MCC6885243.1 site-specific DNA-methyltransferase [Ignavibacteriales bacterium]MCE7953353.1 site-specific DNA-methyltransferase [Chlorobi bacterium CHB7]MDL1887230.1 site-specific DNA-methyltransferase [Ignavibacteria bacterium CHB1]RIK47722.1 MAG: site-specific DNA-methyltransferase [Ignavibacteriota bacterium]